MLVCIYWPLGNSESQQKKTVAIRFSTIKYGKPALKSIEIKLNFILLLTHTSREIINIEEKNVDSILQYVKILYLLQQ